VLIALAIVGMDALRRVAIRDSPEETTATASERWHERFDRVASRARREEPAPPPPAAAGGAERIGALERLARLRDSGAITPDELEREKALVIGSE
jgi:hypothetical protein